MRTLMAMTLTGLLAGVALAGEPLRQDQGWSIWVQQSPADWTALTSGPNLARGRAVQAQPTPNYAHTTDADDLRQLTDGELAGTAGRMWTDTRAVGWAYQDYVRLLLDLGSTQAVGRVVLRLQGGINADTTVPRRIAVGLSQDGEYFFPARTLTEKVHADDNPALTFAPVPADVPGIYAFVLEIGYQARYVRLDLTCHGLLICDEVAVLAAADVVQNLPPAPAGKREWLDTIFDRHAQFSKLTAAGNLVAGRPLRYAPEPTYPLTTNPTDPADLTDGKLGERTDDRIWFEPGAVCWIGVPLPVIFADLGSVQPIASVVARFLGGREQDSLEFPDEIRVLLSTDGIEYSQVAARHRRGLDDLSAEAYDLPEEKLAWVHNFVLPVGYQARYLALQVRHQKQFICSDEIAVVKGAADLPAFTPAIGRKVTLVTSGVAFELVWGTALPVATMPLNTRFAWLDARPGTQNGTPCTLVLDLPDSVRLASPSSTPVPVDHAGRVYQRYRFEVNRNGTEAYLQSLLPAGGTDVLYTYGDCGAGPQNERRLAWESIVIPPVRHWPRRLHVSLAWSASETLCRSWPDYLQAMKHLGFNGIASFPRYWTAADLPRNLPIFEQARQAGFLIIVNESPAGCLEEDRRQAETRSQLAAGPSQNACPAYRGAYYQKEVDSFAQHAAWLTPDCIFYDTEAFWPGAVQEAAQCSRCQGRYTQGAFANWDDFRRAMGNEMQRDILTRTAKAMADLGRGGKTLYGSYRTEPVTPLNDGVLAFGDLYPEVLQVAMPSLYVAGNPMTVADSIAGNRAKMSRNDIIPWLSTATYGEYDPVRTRDMVLETFANGARGVTYYWYGDFTPGHFRYHAEAIDIVSPVEDIIVDGTPIVGAHADPPKIKVCGLALGDEMVVLVSNYQGVPATAEVQVTVPLTMARPVWDLHTGKQTGEVTPGGSFTLTPGEIGAHLFYLGKRYAEAVAR